MSGLVACSAGLLAPMVLSPTMVRAALSPDEALKNLVGTTWMYGGLWTFVRPDPKDPATVRLRFPAEGKVEVAGPCGSEVGELRTAKSEAFGAPFQLVGVFASLSAAECPGSPRQGIVGDLIRSGIEGSTNPIQAMFRSKGHTFFEDTVTGVSPLAGTSWDVESVDGQPLAPLHWNLEFLSTGVFGGSDGCNGFNGSYVTNGDQIRTAGSASTAIGCSYDSPLPRPLRFSQNTRFVLASKQLTISEDGGHMFVLRAKGFGLPLAGTAWKGIVRGQRVSLSFLAESRVRISTPCFSTEVHFSQKKLPTNGMRYLFSFDFAGLATTPAPKKQMCRSGFELLSTLRKVTMSTHNSLALQFGDGQPAVPESFTSGLTVELDTPVDATKELAGSRWVLDTYSPGVATNIEFRANGAFRFTSKFQKQCGNWIYRVVAGARLLIEQKDPCFQQYSSPFALPVLRFAFTPDRKTLELFNIADRSIAMFKRIG